jgi:hypothetical protein
MEFFIKNAGWITTIVLNLLTLSASILLKFNDLHHLGKKVDDLSDNLKEIGTTLVKHGERLATIEGRCAAKSKVRSKRC